MDIKFHCELAGNFKDDKCLVRAFLYADYQIEPHSHDFYEMNIVFGGKGTHQIENACFDVCAGDVFVIPPMTAHSYYNTHGLDVYHVLLQKSFISSNSKEAEAVPGFLQLVEIEPYLRRRFSDAMFLHLTPAQLMDMKADLARIEDGGEFDSEDMQAFRNHSTWVLLYKLSCLLHRQLHHEKKATANKYDNAVVTALEYIHRNYGDKITVETLCKITFLSRSTFLRSFGELCGCTPAQYLTTYRQKKAAEMIEEGTRSKTEIAHLCGFYDLSHMERTIKKK